MPPTDVETPHGNQTSDRIRVGGYSGRVGRDVGEPRSGRGAEQEEGIEILFDPLAMARSCNLAFNPAKHRIVPDGEWIRWARRVTGKPKLFIYFHTVSENYVLACWVYYPTEPCGHNGVATEVHAWPAHPDTPHPERPNRDFLKAVCEPFEEQCQRMKRSLADEKHRERLEADDTDQSKNALMAFYKHCGLDYEAHLLKEGIIPHVGPLEGGEALEENREALLKEGKTIYSYAR